jgi:putative ABC transport system ATP-binding protein
MLELRNVSRVYRTDDVEVVALDDVSLRIEEGDFVAIVGPSGSGKSTLLNVIGLLDLPTSGQVLLDGQDVGTLSDGERAGLRLRQIGFVFQRFHLLPMLTTVENVAVPMEELGVPYQERIDRAARLLVDVGLGQRIGFYPSRLSGGERQRVAICRALANGPELVLADEPTGELHSEDRAKVLEVFQSMNRAGHTLVVVTHDDDTAAIARRRLEIRDGRIAREVLH